MKVLLIAMKHSMASIGVATVKLVVAVGVVITVTLHPAGSQAREPQTTSSSMPHPGVARAFQDPNATSLSPASASGAIPTGVQIPAIGVDSGLEHLSIGVQGELDPPHAWQSAGWYQNSVVPGTEGRPSLPVTSAQRPVLPCSYI